MPYTNLCVALCVTVCVLAFVLSVIPSYLAVYLDAVMIVHLYNSVCVLLMYWPICPSHDKGGQHGVTVLLKSNLSCCRYAQTVAFCIGVKLFQAVCFSFFQPYSLHGLCDLFLFSFWKLALFNIATAQELSPLYTNMPRLFKFRAQLHQV